MRILLAIVVASLLSRLGYQMARSPVLPRFAEDLGAAPELIGMIVAASTVTGIFFKLPAGALSDVLGKKRMLILGAAFFAVPPLLYPLVNGPEALLALRFLHGFATAIFSPVASAYVASLSAERRGVRLGWFASANDVGATAGPLLGGLILFYTASYDVTYLVVAALGVLTFALVLRLPEAPDSEAAPAESQESRWRRFRLGVVEVVSTPPIIVASCLEATMYFGFGAFLGFLPIYAKNLGLNDAEIAFVLGVQLAVAMIAKPLGGWASDRVGRKPVIVGGLLLCALSLPLIFRADDLGALLAIVPVLGLGVATVTPVTNALVADLARERRLGAAMGVFGTVFDVGEAAGPIVAGLLIGQLRYAGTFDVIAALTLAVLIVFVVFVRTGTGAEPTLRP